MSYLQEPSSYMRASTLPLYQADTTLVQQDFGGKVYGIVKCYANLLTSAQLYKSVSHVEYISGSQDTFDKSKLWRLGRIYFSSSTLSQVNPILATAQAENRPLTPQEQATVNGLLASDTAAINAAANTHVTLDLGAIVGQYVEDTFVAGGTNWEQMALLVHQAYKNRYPPGTNANQTNMYIDYFFPQGQGRWNRNSSQAMNGLINGLANATNAKRQFDAGDGSISSIDDIYFRSFNGLCKRQVRGYLDHIGETANFLALYRLIYDFEKAFIADPSIGTICFSFDGMDGNPDVAHYRPSNVPYYVLNMDTYQLLIKQRIHFPYELAKAMAFFSMLMGDGIIMWEDSVLYTDDRQYVADRQYGWKRKPAGAEPPFVGDAEGNQFPVKPASGINGSAAGAWLFAQIKGRTAGIRYMDFQFSRGAGSTISGYSSGNTPMNGALGNANMSVAGAANAGNHNIVNQWIHKRPIVVGNSQMIVCFDAWADPNTTVSVTIPSQSRTITFPGKKLAVFVI